MEIQYTRNREATARALAGHYERVFIRNKNRLWNPLRLRRAVIADLNPYIVLNAPEFDAQLLAWNQAGGALIYDRSYTPSENVGAHHAQLLSECPLSTDLLDAYIEGARELVVIFKPPNWKEHHKWVAANYPPGDLCRRLYDLVMASSFDEAMGEALGFTPGFRVVPEDRELETLAVHPAIVRVVRKTVFRRRSRKTVWRAALRIEPEDRTMAEIYRFIVARCPKVNGVHLIAGGTMIEVVRFWKKALRDLDRCGAIALKGFLQCYWPEELPPNFGRLDRRRYVAERHLREMIKFVEDAPEFNPAVFPPRSCAPESQSPEPLSA